MKYRMHIGVLTVLALGFLAAGFAGQAVADDAVTLIYSKTSDGYVITSVYDVAPNVAAAAYANDAASKAGGGSLYAKDVQGEMTLVGSSQEFINFLDANYPKIAIEKGSRCDNTVTAVWTLTCPFPCVPVDKCTYRVNAKVALTCLNDPPCPEDSVCMPHPERIVVIATNQLACFCNESDECELNGGTTVVAFAATGPVCECEGPGSEPVGACIVDDECIGGLTAAECTTAGGTWQGAGVSCEHDYVVPTLSEWGLIVFSLLILTLITVVVTRRRTATSMAGEGGDITMHGPLFVPRLFMRTLTITMGAAVVVLVVATLLSTTVPLRDIVGTVLSAGIVAYMAHLWFIGRSD